VGIGILDIGERNQSVSGLQLDSTKNTIRLGMASVGQKKKVINRTKRDQRDNRSEDGDEKQDAWL